MAKHKYIDFEAEVAKRKRWQNADTSMVNQAYIDSFLKDADSYFNTAESDYGALNWGNATNSYNTRNQTWNDLTQRADAVGAWLYNNRNSISKDVYNSYNDYLNAFSSGGSDLLNAFKGTADLYGSFDSQEAYDAWKKEQDNYEAIRNSAGYSKYVESGKNSQGNSFFKDILNIADGQHYTIKELISDIKEGDWLNLGGKAFEQILGRISPQVSNALKTASTGLDLRELAGEWLVDRSRMDKYLTDDEMDMYHYYIGKGDYQAAEDYYNNYSNLAKVRSANELTKMFNQSLGETGVAFGSGVSSFVSGYDTALSRISSLLYDKETKIQDPTVLQYAFSEMSADNKGLWDITNKLAQTIGNQVPSMVMNAMTGGVGGAAVMGFSASGNAYAEAINSGEFTETQAIAYATSIGFLEAKLQEILGGITGLGSEGGIVSKQAEKLIPQITKALPNILRKLGNLALSTTASSLDEGFEEAVQEILDPFVKALTTGNWGGVEDLSTFVDWGAVGESALLGALSGGLLEGGTNAINMGTTAVGVNQAFKDVRNDPDSLKALLTSIAMENPNADIKPLMDKFNEGKKIPTKELKNLVYTNEEALWNKDKAKLTDATEARLTELGETNNARKLAESIVNAQYGDFTQALDASEQAIANNKNLGIKDLAYLMAEQSTESKGKISRKDKKTLKENNAAFMASNELNPDYVKNHGGYAKGKTSRLGQTAASVATTRAKVEALKTLNDSRKNIPSPSFNYESGVVAPHINEKGVEAKKMASTTEYANVMGYRGTTNEAFSKYYKGEDLEKYGLAFNEAYEMGKQGIPKSELDNASFKGYANEEAIDMAYQSGVLDAKYEAIKTEKVKVKGGATVTVPMSTKGLKESQKATIELMKVLAEVTHTNMAVMQSATSHGLYDPKTNTISIDINLGGRDFMITSLSHELTHHLAKAMPEKFDEFARVLFEEVGKVKSTKEAIEVWKKNNKKYYPKYTEAELNALAREEVVAEMCESFLTDEKVAQRISQKVYEADKGLWNTIKKWLEDFVAKIKSLFADLDPQSENGRIVKEMGDKLDAVKQMWADMVVESGEIATEATQEQIKNSRKDLEKLDADYLSAVERGDTETAQRMVDEAAKNAGYIVGAYHGTRSDFTVFDRNRSGNNYNGWSKYGKGFYFAETTEDAEHWSAMAKGLGDMRTIPSYLRMENPFVLNPEEYETVEAMVGKMDNLADYVQSKGYDGIISPSQYVVFNPEQIKSADPVTYDDEGNVIPLSQRFNEENEDIRYSIKKIVDENGNDYGMGVYLDSTLLSNLTDSERIEMVKEYVKELGGKTFTAYDNNGIAVDITISKYTDKFKNKSGKRVRVNQDMVNYLKNETKQDAIALIDELILTSVYTGKEPAHHPHDWVDNNGKNDWDVWETYLQDKENTIWRAKLRIANSRNGDKILYDIFPIEKVEAAQTMGTSSTNNNISQPKPIVNTNSENSSEILNSRKAADPFTSREALAKALSKVAKGEDRAIVESYKANVNLIKGETERANNLRKEIDEIKYKKSITYEGRELSVKEFEQIAYTKAEEQGIDAEKVKFKALRDTGKYVAMVDGKKFLEAEKRFRSKEDIERLATLEQNYNATLKRISGYDKKLLNIEAMSSIKQLIAREKKASYDKAKAEGKVALKEAKEQAITKQKEITAKYQESRRKNVEGRRTTEMRHKLLNTVHTLDQLLVNPTKKKHIPIGLQKPIAEALNVLNRETDSVRMAESLARLKIAYGKILESDDYIIRNSHDEVIAGMIDKLIDEVEDTPVREMNLKQLELAYNTYKALLKTVRDANKAFAAAKGEEITKLADDVMGELETYERKNKAIPKVLDNALQLEWTNLKPTYAFERIGSSTFTELYNNIRHGEDVWAKDVNDARAFFDKQKKQYGFDKWDFKKKYAFTSKHGRAFELTLEQIMSIYAYTRRGDQAIEHLVNGGFVFDKHTVSKETIKGKLEYEVVFDDPKAYSLSEEIIGRINATLTEQQMAFARAMQEYLSKTMGDKGNEVSRQLYDINIFGEENYFPLKTSEVYKERVREQARGEVKIKNKGFTKETTPHSTSPVVLTPFTDVWATHCIEMSMYHAFTLPLEDFYRVYNYKERADLDSEEDGVTRRLEEAFGKAVTNYIDQLLVDVNGGTRGDPRASALDKGLATFKKAKVMGSLSVVIQQPSAIVRAIAYIDLKYFIDKPSKPNHKANWEELKKYAPVAIIKEMGKFDVGVGQSTVDWVKNNPTLRDKIDEVVSKAPAYADEMGWISIWKAVKREVAATTDLKVNSEEFLQRCGERFTEVVSKTQVYDSVFARSGYMRSKDVGAKMFTAFMAEPTTTLNILEDAVMKAIRGNPKFMARAITSCLASSLINSALVSVVYAMRDDDDEEYWKKYLSTLGETTIDNINPLNMMPYIRDIWSMVQGYRVSRSDLTLWQEIIWDINRLNKNEYAKFEDWINVISSISQVTGIPLKNLLRDARGIWNTAKSLIK